MLTIEPIIFHIVVFNIFYMACFTLRMLLVMKGQKILASIISILEVYIYLLGLAIVLENLKNPLNLLGYCIGWGMGVYIGSRIEEYLALGYVTVQAIVPTLDSKLPAILQKRGFGVTSWRAGERTVIQILIKRRYEQKVIQIINNLSPNAFVISYDLKNFKEGFKGK